MGVALSATVFVWFAQGIAFLLLPWSLPLSTRLRAVAFWAIATPILFTLRDPLAALLVIGVIMFVVAPFSAAERVAFFLMAVPAVPVFVSAPMPFPGINYLIELTHYKVAALMLLPLALLIGNGQERQGRAFGTTDASLAVYVVYTAFLVGADENFTSGTRFLLDQILILLLPYVAIHFVLRGPKDIDTILKGFLIVSVFLAAVSIVSFAKRWDIYGILNPAPFTEFRYGRPRIDATMNTHSLGFHLAAAIVVLEYLKHRISIGWLRLNALRVFLFVGIIPTDSRGAYASLVIALGVYIVLMMRSATAKVSAIVAGVIGLIGVGVWLAGGDMTGLDEHGTFVYRQMLLVTSLDYVARYPLFGDLNYATSDAFQHLVTGLGIIDITNLYLLIALKFGLLGFALFFWAFASPLVALGSRLVTSSPWGGEFAREGCHMKVELQEGGKSGEYANWHRAAAAAVGILMAWFFLVTTTSDVGLTLHIGIVFAAVCRGLRAMRPVTEAATPRVPTPSRPVREAAIAT